MSAQDIVVIVFICLFGVISLGLWTWLLVKWLRQRRNYKTPELKLKVQTLSQYLRNNWLFLTALLATFLTLALLVVLLRNLLAVFQ